MKNKLTFFSLLIAVCAFSQEKSVDEIIKSGNEFYKLQQFARASEEYLKALNRDPSNTGAKFNQANSLYKQDKKVEASVLLAELAAKVTEAPLLAKVYYNKGVILSQQKNIEESIEAYKSALRNDPADKDARENLQKALLELKKKKEQKKKENDQQKKKKEEPQKQPQSKMNPREAEQRLKLLQQKEKETQERVQKEKMKTGGSQTKDW